MGKEKNAARDTQPVFFKKAAKDDSDEQIADGRKAKQSRFPTGEVLPALGGGLLGSWRASGRFGAGNFASRGRL